MTTHHMKAAPRGLMYNPKSITDLVAWDQQIKLLPRAAAPAEAVGQEKREGDVDDTGETTTKAAKSGEVDE